MIRSNLPNTKLLPRQMLNPPEQHPDTREVMLNCSLHVHSFSLHYVSESSKAPSNSRRTSQRRGEWLTDDFHFIGGVDLPSAVGHVTGVFAAVFRREVLQAESPLLLAALTHLSGRQRPAVLQPDDVGSGVPARGALQPYWAPHRTCNHALSHFCWLREAGPHYKERNKKKMSLTKKKNQR